MAVEKLDQINTYKPFHNVNVIALHTFFFDNFVKSAENIRQEREGGGREWKNVFERRYRDHFWWRNMYHCLLNNEHGGKGFI